MTVIYSPSDVQKLLEIKRNTLQKYAVLLEGQGYHVQRNNKGHRSYFEKDVIMLRKLIELSKQEGMTIERSVEAVMTWVSEEDKTVTETEVVQIQPTIDRDVEQNFDNEKLLEGIEHLEQINLELISHMKEKAIRDAKQEEKINQILKYIERMEQLEAAHYKAMEEETRNQVAAASQKKWWQFWRK